MGQLDYTTTEINTALEKVIDADSSPVEASSQMVTSGGVFAAIAGQLATLPVVVSGTGAVSVGDLDGNTRGAEAVNVQASRNSAAQVASGLRALAVGHATTASGSNSVGVGNQAGATNQEAVAVGRVVTASAPGSTAIGQSVTVTGENAVGVGRNVVASGANSLALGRATALGAGSTAIGGANTATANGQQSVAVGSGASCEATYSGAFAYNASAAVGTQSLAIGPSTGASADKALVFGKHTQCSVANTLEIGWWSNGIIRGAAVRMHGNTGQISSTLQNRSTAYADGGSTPGPEAENTLPREAFSIRRNGDELFIDVNIEGTVKTVSLGTAS